MDKSKVFVRNGCSIVLVKCFVNRSRCSILFAREQLGAQVKLSGLAELVQVEVLF
jgi:hypothetical protein